MMEQSMTEALEDMVDKHGLLDIVTGLDLICQEKAEHIKVDWQDKSLAKKWQRHSSALYAASRKISNS